MAKTIPFEPVIMSNARFFGRLGDSFMLKTKVAEARQNGAVVQEDYEAGTVIVSFRDQDLFRAIQKSNDSWIIMYNPAYYPRE